MRDDELVDVGHGDVHAQALEMSATSIVVEHVESAGCYGHNGSDDAAFDAVLLARAVPGVPVQVQWTRRDELTWSPFGSAMVSEVAADLDRNGGIVSWGYDVATSAGLQEAQYDDLLNFEASGKYDERQKAALSYAEAIAWNTTDADALWERLHAHFTEPELVELGCFIALTFGQQSWIRLLGIDHHQYMAGSAASMAPGFRSPDELAESKASEDYWAAKP